MELINDKYIQFIDVETTGFDVWRNSMIAFSSVIATKDGLEFIDQYTGYSKPESKKFWSDDAEKIHGFTYKEAMKFPEPRQAGIDFLKFLKPYKHDNNFPMLSVYHGAGNFDLRWCDAFFAKNKLWHSWQKVSSMKQIESTMYLAKSHMEADNYKLDTVCKILGIDLDHHKAESDALACFLIYKKLKEMEI
jgi:DNA polymerase III epsilon subunit-like protein